ncbi:MAG: alanine racemase [Ruthenibacterium sp.]
MTEAVLRSIAAQYGTPCFVFDTDVLSLHMAQVQEILGSNVHLCYSIKANPFLIREMLRHVEWLEVCSPGELHICEELGISRQRILFSGVSKTPQDIEQALADDVGLYTAESLRQVELLQSAASAQKRVIPVLLRVAHQSQFGMDEQVLADIVRRSADYPALHFVGIHFFTGTQKKRVQEIERELTWLETLCARLRQECGFSCERIEYGPGLCVPYFEDDNFETRYDMLKEIAPHLRRLSDQFQLTVEMGRFFTAQCGSYLTTVTDCKQNGDTSYALVDGGIHHVNYYGQMMGMKVPMIRHFHAFERAPILQAAQTRDWTLCGSLCTTADVLVRKVHMEGLATGDILVFENLGAYSVTEGLLLFLSRAMPRILLYSEAQGSLLQREAIESYRLNTILKGEF